MIWLLLIALSFVLYSFSIPLFITSLIWSLFTGFIHYRILERGKNYAWRSVYFILLSLFFILGFRLLATEETPAPYCHIGLTGNIIHTFYSQLLSIIHSVWWKYGALSAGLFWLAVLFINGGGFCSYVCFFGGIDEGFSRILKKPLITLPSSKRFREFQFASLLFFSFISFTAFEPVFCLWICPFKLTDGILNPEAPVWLIQVFLYIITGSVFLVILPLLTKKRTFCSIICPFGALYPLLHRLNPYKMKIDGGKCSRCRECLQACPSFAIEEDKEGIRINRYCTLCGKCIEVCSRNAIKTTLFTKRESSLAVTVSMALGGSISLFIVPRAVMRLIEWAAGLFRVL
jgi:polyferredoxin